MARAASDVLEVLLNHIKLLTWLPTHIAILFDMAVAVRVVVHAPVAVLVLVAHCGAIFDGVDIASDLYSFPQKVGIGTELIAHTTLAGVDLLAIGAFIEGMCYSKDGRCHEKCCREANHIDSINERQNN